MTKILFTPGLGNQFFQAAAALQYRCFNEDLGRVVLCLRYLSNKHDGVLLTSLPFIRGIATVKARWVDDVAYLVWQRAGHLGVVRRVMGFLGYWMEPPLPSCHQSSKFDYKFLSTHKVGAGYFQDVSPHLISLAMEDLIDLSALSVMFDEQNIRAAHCIHIRAGDYQSAGIYNLLDSSYYLSAIRAMAPFIGEDARWEVITDNPDDLRVQEIYNSLRVNGVSLEAMSRGTAVHDLLRLIGARSLVCANSTYSVAAAYIRSCRNHGANPPCVPRVWFNTPSLKAPGFYPESWIIC